MITLRPYQLEIMRAVRRSIERGYGDTITVEIARQGGKNETSAQLETLLMIEHGLKGGTGLKASPTLVPQTVNSIERLRTRLRDHRIPHTLKYGTDVWLGQAGWYFRSAGPEANVVGATATILLEGDEAQDIDPDKWQRDFRPMGATANTTSVLWGTAWTDDTLLEQTKQSNLELARKDGRQRHFEYDWTVVARHNEAYAAYVRAERERLGPDHPLFTTQYELRPLSSLGRMFTTPTLALMRAEWETYDEPRPADRYLAALDIAGADEAVEDPERILQTHSARDSTTLLIGTDRNDQAHIVAGYSWTNVPHHTQLQQVTDLLRRWRVRLCRVDATGIGAPVAAALARELGRIIEPFVFTTPAKSELGYGLISAATKGKLQIASNLQELHTQLRLARTQVRPNRTLNFYVEERDGHDDWIMALAMLAAILDTKPRTASGRNQ